MDTSFADGGSSTSLFSALGELDIGISLVDETGTIVFANDRYAGLFGKRRESLIGASFVEVLEPAERDAAYEFHRRLLSAPERKPVRSNRTRVFFGSDGKRLEYAAISLVWKDGSGKALRATVVHDRTQYVDAIERAESVASILIRNPNPVLELDRTGSVLFVNISAKALFPGIEAAALRHPYLAGIDLSIAEGASPTEELQVEGRWYLRIAHAPVEFPDRIRVYGFETSERKLAELRLTESETRLRAILDNSRQAFVLVGLDGKVSLFNRRAEEMVGLAMNRLLAVGVPVSDFVRNEDMDDFRLRFSRALEGESERSVRLIEIPGLGERLYVDVEYSPIRDSEGRLFAVCMILSDITEARYHEEQAALTRLVFDNTKEGILVTDAEARILSVNRAFTEISGYSAEEIAGRNPRLLQSGWQTAQFYEQLWAGLARDGSWQGEIWDRRKDGSLYAQWSSITAVKDETGAVKNYVAIVNEITEQKAAAERIRHLAYYDTLTELPNRALLFDRLNHALDSARRAGTRIALLFIDLDRFKSVNDSFGHEEGDRFLRETARRIRSVMRASDTVARLGGDEFTVLVEGVAAPEDAAQVAEKVLAALAAPYKIQDTEFFTGASIGIAVTPDDGSELELLLRNADSAMYRVKESGRNGYQFYRPEMNEKALERLRIESRLRRAEEERALKLNFQPQIRISDGELVGWEALLRWNPEGIGPVPPSVFIPMAEENGFISAIGDWVLREALSVRRTTLTGTMAVNLSAKQFASRNLVAAITRMLEETGLEGSSLELEITESAVMRDVEFSVGLLRSLKALGIGIAIDDFGTGYSSLSYLKRFPIDKLKIDRSFVADLPGDAEDAAIARTIVGLARGLGMRTIAEGVETEAQLAFLREIGCDEYQGYFGSRPLPLDAAAAFKPPR